MASDTSPSEALESFNFENVKQLEKNLSKLLVMGNIEMKKVRSYGGNLALALSHNKLTDPLKIKERSLEKKLLKAYIKGQPFIRTYPKGLAGNFEVHRVPVKFN